MMVLLDDQTLGSTPNLLESSEELNENRLRSVYLWRHQGGGIDQKV